MPEVTRYSRSAYTGRDRDDYSSDDERSTYSRSSRHGGGESYRTVQRYRVAPRDEFSERHSSRVEVVQPRSERIEIDRRSERFVEPERPRSSIDRPRTTVVSERYVERDGVRDPVQSRTVVYDRESTRDSKRPWERDHRPWESDIRETDVRVEKQVVRREERREEQPFEVERYQRETEYYERPDPPPQPIVIRQRAPEPQQIIVQEAPAPPPIIVPRPEQQSYEIIRREERREEIVEEPRRDHEDEYYYRRDTREYDGQRDEDVQVARYDRRGRENYDRYSDDEDWTRRRTVVRERTRSASNHKRHLAEGALAGAGAAALLAHHKSRQGEPVDHRGRNVVGGAALGAIGAEVLTRAKSRYDERQENRSRSSSRSKVKTGLGLAAAALLTSAAVKYAKNRKANKEELVRGRSRQQSRSRRRRYDSRGSYSSYSSVERTTSVHRDPKHRNASIAKAGAATAIAAGVVNHIRSRSRKRNGERSKSRIRTGAGIVGSGLAGAAVAGLYENRKAKEEKERDERYSRSRSRSRSRTHRSRSRARSIGAYSDPGIVTGSGGMVEYGAQPVYKEVTTTTTYDETTDGSSRRRSRRRRHSSSSSGGGKSRSRSRLRNVAGGVGTAAAAAIGVNQYQKRKEKKERERERERRRYEESPPGDYYDDYSPSPPHASGGSFYPSGSEYAPPQQVNNKAYHSTTTFAAPSVFNDNNPHVAQPPIPTYNPQDYGGPPPPGNYEFTSKTTTTRTRDNNVSTTEPHYSFPPGNRGVPQYGNATNIPYFPPPPTSPFSEPRADALDRHEEGLVRSRLSVSSVDYARPHNRSVTFAPLSPTSARTLGKNKDSPIDSPDTSLFYTNRGQPTLLEHSSDSPVETGHKRRRRRRRRNSDPSSDRPRSSTKSRRSRHHKRSISRDASPIAYSDESDVEILPDRFDESGRPLERRGNLFPRGSGGGGGKESEMVEKIVRDVGDIVDGRKTWKDLLRGVMDDAGGVDSGSDGGQRRRRRRRT